MLHLRVSLWEPILDFYGRISDQLVGQNIAYFIWHSNTMILVTQEYMSSHGTRESHLRRLQMQKLIFIEKWNMQRKNQVKTHFSMKTS